MTQLISEVNKNQDDLKEVLTGLVKKYRVSYILSTLAQISFERSDECNKMAEGSQTALEWEVAGFKIEDAESKISPIL